MAVPNTCRPELCGNVREGAMVCTDALMSSDDLERDYDCHAVDHMESHVKGSVHTNGLENFWSLLKRSLKGTYVERRNRPICFDIAMSRHFDSTSAKRPIRSAS